MVHGSLFSGIGGFDLAAEWAGFTNAFHCEINPFSRRVLHYHFPTSVSYEDITKTDFTEWRGKINILSGGFPCQPFSVAGDRLGAEDDRYLWPQMLRAIDEIKPAWVVGENVAGLLSMVQPCMPIKMASGADFFGEDYDTEMLQQEFVLRTIYRDFERIGYEVQSFVVPACAVGAPHRRDRIWIVANRADAGIESMQREGEDGVCESVSTPDSEGSGIKGERLSRQRKIEPDGQDRQAVQTFWREFPTQPPICGGDDGLPEKLDAITFPKWRQESVKAYGNAIVPQVALEIFNAIKQL